MRYQISVPLSGERTVKLRYASENVSPETYYDHMHDHPVWEVCVMLSGSMLHIAGGRSYHLARGDVFFCRPGELHYALAAEQSVYERYAFWIPADAFSWIAGGEEEAMGVFSDPRLEGENVIHLDMQREGELIAILDSIRRVISRGHEASPLESLCRLTDLLLFVGDAAKLPSRGHDSDSGYEHSPEIIHKVIRYVRDNYRTISGISEIADHFYINKDYLTRVFRKFTGFTVHDYIRSVRISKSRVMLSGGSGVTEAAFACGFNSTSYFIRVFTKAVGVTPAQYRRSVNGDTLSE